VHKTFSTEQFISMVYAEFNSNNGLVTYVNAGHSNPILLHKTTDQVERLTATGQLLGPFPNEKYHTEFALMQSGDILLLYTDGVTEASNENGEMYGERRLIPKLRELRNKNPKEICQLILEDVQIYSRLSEYADDKTLLVIRKSR